VSSFALDRGMLLKTHVGRGVMRPKQMKLLGEEPGRLYPA
jgi:hypothetical protein